MSFLYILPNEILQLIFNFCDVYTLSQISMVCKHFYIVVCDILQKKSEHLLVTNEKSERFRERCKLLLSSYKAKFITHYNWKDGKYKKSYKHKIKTKEFFYLRNKCIQMTKNTIWLDQNDCLLAYNRTKNGTIRKNERIVGTFNKYISDIAYCNDVIISGHRDGSIRHWKIESQSKTNYIKQLKEMHDVVHDNLRDIDATPQHIITNYVRKFSHSTIMIQKNTLEIDDSTEKTQIFHNKDNCYVRSILFDPEGIKFAASFETERQSTEHPLLIYDINRCHSVIDKEYNDKFTQLLWEDPHTILLLNCTYITKMDIRTSEFVHTWNVRKNNCSNTLSCFSSDNLYTIMTGTFASNIILWDQRQSAIVQTYNINNYEESIRSLQFDSAHMYAATNKNLIEFDFKEGDITCVNRVTRANCK